MNSPDPVMTSYQYHFDYSCLYIIKQELQFSIYNYVVQQIFFVQALIMSAPGRVRDLQPCHCPQHNGSLIPFYDRIRCHRRSLEVRKSDDCKVQPRPDESSSSEGIL